MSTRKPLATLHLTTTDPEAAHALGRTQLRAAGYVQPRRTTTLSARVSPASRDAVRSVARRMGVSTSVLLGLLVDEIAAPAGAAAKVLEEIAKLLALPPGSSVDEILKAVGALSDDLADDGAPTDAQYALQANPDPDPAKLSRTFTTSRGAVTLSASEVESCKEAGATPEAYAENKAIRDAARRPARAASDPLRAVQAARRDQARRR